MWGIGPPRARRESDEFLVAALARVELRVTGRVVPRPVWRLVPPWLMEVWVKCTRFPELTPAALMFRRVAVGCSPRGLSGSSVIKNIENHANTNDKVDIELPFVASLFRLSTASPKTRLASVRRILTIMISSVVIADDADSRSCNVVSSCL